MLDILAGREKVQYEPTQEAHLLLGVAEVLGRRGGRQADIHSAFQHIDELNHDDKLIALEVFWDLILDRVITPGYNYPNSKLPHFRLHSEAGKRLKRQ